MVHRSRSTEGRDLVADPRGSPVPVTSYLINPFFLQKKWTRWSKAAVAPR
jgi:hypothetical protein